MAFTAAELMHLESGLPRLGAFFHLATEPAVRLWLGVGGIAPGVNAVDTTGATYRGVGELIDVPAFAHLFDGTADRAEFIISGVPETALAQVAPHLAEQQAAIQGVQVHAGWAAMDYQWRLIGPVHWEWFGFADLIRVRHSHGSGVDDPATATLALSCGDWMTGRRRPGLSFLTNADQQRRSYLAHPELPPDRYAERARRLSSGRGKSMAASIAATALDDLDGFLSRERGRRWSWANTNCALWVADWIVEASGIDPAHAMRGRASDAEGWKAVLDSDGGFMPIIGHAMDTCGFERTQSPHRGDVAIVSVPVANHSRMPVAGTVAAICLADRLRATWPLFVVRSIVGLHYERYAMVTAWRIARRGSATVH